MAVGLDNRLDRLVARVHLDGFFVPIILDVSSRFYLSGVWGRTRSEMAISDRSLCDENVLDGLLILLGGTKLQRTATLRRIELGRLQVQ
jgi:hypothetical protein